MVVIALICHREQALIETCADLPPALVSPNQQDRLSLRIEGKGHSPDLTVPGKPKFFHVGVLRGLQGVDRRSPQIGSKLSQQLGVCQQFVLKLVHQGFELGIEGIVKENGPSYEQIMYLKTYGVKSIFCPDFISTIPGLRLVPDFEMMEGMNQTSDESTSNNIRRCAVYARVSSSSRDDTPLTSIEAQITYEWPCGAPRSDGLRSGCHPIRNTA